MSAVATMSDFYTTTNNLINEMAAAISDVPIAVAIGSIYLFSGVILYRSRFFRNFIARLMPFILYSERSSNTISTHLIDRITELEDKIELKSKNGDVINANQATKKEIDEKISEYMRETLVKKGKLDDLVRRQIDMQLRLNKEIRKFDNIERINKPQRQIDEEGFESYLDEQSKNVATIRTVMINLFIIVNLGLLITYLFRDDNSGKVAIQAILGFYISLALFIVYIYRSANSRSNMILAIREDFRKLHLVNDYLSRFAEGRELTESELAIIKIISINHSEREKTAEHPYEIALKGITNSTVMLKGGKIHTTEKESKK